MAKYLEPVSRKSRRPVKARSVTISEIKRGNKRMCLSPLRALNRCFDCPGYTRKVGTFQCESRIDNPEYNRLMEERRAELDRHKATKEAIDQAIKDL